MILLARSDAVNSNVMSNLKAQVRKWTGTAQFPTD